MGFTGYVRPFELRLANSLELINDTIIVVCSYFLVIFSGMVDDPETKYLCGWPLIGLIFLLIGLNLTVIMVRSISSLIHSIRLRLKRGRNRRKMYRKALKA